jgi:hypothetical protein
MKNLLENLVFNIGSESFYGLKFRSHINYPWKNKDESRMFYDDLTKEKTFYNRQRYKDLIHLQNAEDIHIKISKMIVFEMLSHFFLLIGLITLIGDFHIISISFLSLGLIFLLIRLIFRNKIRNITNNLQYTELSVVLIITAMIEKCIININPSNEMVDILIDFMFTEECK